MCRVSVMPSLPSGPGSRKLHCHCWPTTSISVASAGTVTNWCQTNRPGASRAATPRAGDDGQPPFEPAVLRLVGGLARAVAEPVEAIGHEGDDGDEHRAGDPERDDDRVVDVAPVRRDGRPPPWTEQVEHHRADDHRHQDQRNNHSHHPQAGRQGALRPERPSELPAEASFHALHRPRGCAPVVALTAATTALLGRMDGMEGGRTQEALGLRPRSGGGSPVMLATTAGPRPAMSVPPRVALPATTNSQPGLRFRNRHSAGLEAPA